MTAPGATLVVGFPGARTLRPKGPRMKAGIENRRTSRFTVPLEHEAAVLRLESGMVLARLVDQSAGGFTVHIEPPSDVQAGALGQLRWVGGWSHVRVKNRVDQESDIRLGLERVEDIAPEWEIDPQVSVWSARRPRTPMPGRTAAVWVYGSLVAVGFMLAAGLWILMPYATGGGLLHAPPGRSGRVTDRVTRLTLGARHAVLDSAGTQPFAGQKTRSVRPFTASALTLAAEGWVMQRLGAMEKTAKDIVRMVLNLPVDWRSSAAAVGQAVGSLEQAMQFDDSVVLTLPKFMDHLQFTDQQRAQIEAIIQSTRDATQGIYRQARQLGTEAAMQQIDHIRREGSEQAMVALTPEQIEELKSLVVGKYGAATARGTSEPSTTP